MCINLVAGVTLCVIPRVVGPTEIFRGTNIMIIMCLPDETMGLCWQEYIRDLEKEEEEQKRLQKVTFRAYYGS